MLLMQILSSLARQWRECGVLERVLVAVLVSALVLSLVASAFYGALVVAAAFGLIVLSRTGLMASPYKKMVGSAIKPLYQLRSEERKRDSDLQELVGRFVKAQPPSGRGEEHTRLVESLRELIEARQSQLARRDMRRYAVAAISLRREMDRWLQCHNGAETSDSDTETYVHEIRNAIRSFYAKDDTIAAQRHQAFSSAVANLREIAPPARRVAIHRDLIETVVRMDELTTHQRTCLSEANEAGVVSTAAEFAASGASVQGAIRRVRGWR